MKKVIFVLFVLTIVSSTSAQWTRTNGPEGVAVRFLTNINGTIYAGTEVNGVYISTDDGVNWIARNVGIETRGISSIISFQGFILVGTLGAGVYRSSDGGQMWIAPSNGGNFFVESMVVDDSYIFAATLSEGVQRSSDNGVTWEPKLTGLFGFGEICKSGNKVIASSSNYTLFSIDHGETWSYITYLDGAIIFSYYTMGDTIFAGGQTKIYRSLDNGNTFTTINLDPGFSIVNIYAFASINSTLDAATSYDGVYKSTDFGLNWVPANNGMGPKDVRALTLTDASSLIAGTHYVGMYRSTDLGLSWNKSQTGFPAGTSILSLLESESSIYAGTRDGVFRTDDDGDSWTKMGGINDTTMYSDIWAMCEHNGVIYASMQLYFDATIYKTTDKGSTWIRCGLTGLPAGLSFIKGLEGSGNNLVAGTDEGIYYSSNGGDNWYPTNIQNVNIPSLASSGNFVCAAVPSGAGIYRSVDNGVSWTLSLQSTVDYVEVAAVNNYAFAGAFFGGARYTSNYGNTWFASNGLPSDASVFALGPVADGMVLAGTDLEPSWIYVSFNNGTSYSPYSEGLFERASVEAFAVNETFTFAGTDYNGVWRRYLPGVPVELSSFTATTDENTVTLSWETATETNNSGFEIQRKGFEWERIGFVEGNGTTTEENSYSFIDDNLKAGTYQYRLKQIDYDGSFELSDIVEVEILTPIEFSLSQNYPNPFNPETTVKYNLNTSGFVSIKIYNYLGQEINTILEEFQKAGEYTISWNGTNKYEAIQSSGIYFLKLNFNSISQTIKMTLVK